ncbi:hypothetical protein BC831DRAFT_135169 [Entophlyctis helioformis]|nr:hypothetical protein BC831DRAFT_135169 [Entophlyctis helioformis]
MARLNHSGDDIINSRVMHAMLARMRATTDVTHLTTMVKGLQSIFSSFGLEYFYRHALDCGILDTLNTALETSEQSTAPDIFTAVAGIMGYMARCTEIRSLLIFDSPVMAKLVAGIAHTNETIAASAFESVYSVLQYTTDFTDDVVVDAYMRHGLIQAAFSQLRHNTSNPAEYIDLLDKMLQRYKCEAVNVALEQMADVGFPALLIGLASDVDTPAHAANAANRLVHTYFPDVVMTGDTSILPNEDNADLPGVLIPEMEQPRLTVKERQYLGLLGAILSKPLWWTKFTDPGIAAKWREEAVAQGVSQRALSLLFSELAYLAEHEVRTVELASGDVVTVTPGAAKCTTVSDDAVPATLRDALVRQVAVLEDVPDRKKDWHPGSDGKVLDLVHPSLYPLVYGRSLVLSRSDRVKTTSTPPWDVVSASERVSGQPVFESRPQFISQRFQWLPSEFRVHDDGTVGIASYINNLHPIWHNSLYKTIAKVFERFVPLFESLFGHSDGIPAYITEPHDEMYLKQQQHLKLMSHIGVLPSDDDDAGYKHARQIIMEYRGTEDDNDNDEEGDEEDEDDEEEEEEDEEEDEDDEEEDDDDDDDEEEDEDDEPAAPRPNRFLQPRLPTEFTPPETPFAPVSLRGRNLQVIVKLASIHLTPENPSTAAAAGTLRARKTSRLWPRASTTTTWPTSLRRSCRSVHSTRATHSTYRTRSMTTTIFKSCTASRAVRSRQCTTSDRSRPLQGGALRSPTAGSTTWSRLSWRMRPSRDTARSSRSFLWIRARRWCRQRTWRHSSPSGTWQA